MRESFKEKIASATDLLDILLILKEVTMLDTHVATLAYLEENLKEKIEATDDNPGNKFGIWRCRPFPLEEGQDPYTIQAYYFTEKGNPSEDGLKKGDIVVILYMDRNFINNLQTFSPDPQVTPDLTLHSLKFGVILNSL